MFSVVAVVVLADEMPVAIVCELNDGIVTAVYTSLSVTSLAPVPVNVWAAAVPLIVPELDEPVNFNSLPVPVKLGCEEVAELMPVAIVWLENDGSVTAVGVFCVKLPALQPIVRVSFETLVVNTGNVHDAFVPAVTEPPPVALDATYFVVVLGVTVIVGVLTVPAGV